MSNKPLVIVIVGPTASGKSDLAVKLAKKFNGEIISADSRQVYRGLDIGTGKVSGKWEKCKAQNVKRKTTAQNSKIYVYKNIPHYCIDFVKPKRIFTVVEFKARAEQVIKDIVARGKIPVVVGGTGFWIDALIFNLFLPNVPPDKKLRRGLSLKGTEELSKILKKLDPERAKKIDRHNPRRLIRAIEIAVALNSSPPLKGNPIYKALWIGVAVSRDKLHKKIRLRLNKHIRSGMIGETWRLRRTGLSWKRFYELGLQYKFLADLLNKKISRKEFVKSLNTAIRQYAKRQTTWFKRNKKIHWVKSGKEAEKLVRVFIKN